MSKSKGNIIYADYLSKKYGADAVRYYLLSEIPFTQDGAITYKSFITKYNSDLANTLGNLVNRTVAMTNKYFGGKVKTGNISEEIDKELISLAEETVKKYYALMDEYHNSDACNAVINLAKRCNKYIDETAPWALAKDEANADRLETVLYNLLECIRLLGIMLCPIIPDCSKKIAEQLNTSDKTLAFGSTKEFSVATASALFARLDTEKELKEISEELAKEKGNKSENTVKLSEISIEDFAKVELKTALVKACEPIKKAKKLLKLTLDDGSGTERTVVSGIAEHYSPEDLIGHTVIAVSNLKPAKLCGVESNGMILAADSEGKIKVIFADGIKAGSKVR